MLEALFGLSPMVTLLYGLGVTHFTIAAVTIFLHRHQAHRALDLHPAVSHVFRFWLWLTTGMVTREWVAVHRKHHAKCETPDDPHSPQILGLWKVLFAGVVPYRAEADKPETLARYGRGTPNDWLERHLYTRFPRVGIALMLGLDLLLVGPIGLVVWLFQMVWIPFWAAGVINGVGHAVGYRRYATPDASTNIVPWGIVIGGEELHNNHHAFPASARFSSQRWEIDIGWCYIRMLESVRLAKVTRVAPPPLRLHGMAQSRTAFEHSAVARLQLLQAYSRRVLLRVHRMELRRLHDRRLRAILRPARCLLRWPAYVLDADSGERLREVLLLSEPLRTAYQFCQSLQAVWQPPHSDGQDGVLKAVQLWCREAETSGIDALREFSIFIAGGHTQGEESEPHA